MLSMFKIIEFWERKVTEAYPGSYQQGEILCNINLRLKDINCTPLFNYNKLGANLWFLYKKGSTVAIINKRLGRMKN